MNAGFVWKLELSLPGTKRPIKRWFSSKAAGVGCVVEAFQDPVEITIKVNDAQLVCGELVDTKRPEWAGQWTLLAVELDSKEGFFKGAGNE